MVFTSKPVSDNYLGQTVWLLSGEKQGTRTVYQLEYAFVVDAIETENGRHALRGKVGFMPARPTPVRFAPWLVQMQKRTRNFSNGLSLLPDELVPAVAETLAYTALGKPGHLGA